MANEIKNNKFEDSSERRPAPRPYTTLDIRGTEIKVTPIAEPVARTATTVKSQMSEGGGETPLPAAASTYSDSSTSARAQMDPTKAQTAKPTGSGAQSATAVMSAARSPEPKAQPRVPEAEPKVIIQKRGGFFSHLAAGIVGGLAAFGAGQWALPQIGADFFPLPKAADKDLAMEARLSALEKRDPGSAPESAVPSDRLEKIEKALQDIPALAERQTKLAADTKAALASAAGDAGVPEQLTRLAKLEEQLKAMTEAGASDPNAGRVPQLATLTGKVSDLETSLATQLTALRKSVGEDIEGRMTAATEASEAAKSGTQRIDREIAAIKGEALKAGERLQAMTANSEKLAETVAQTQQETAAVKSALDGLKTAFAKPADVTAAIAPVSAKLDELDKDVQAIATTERDRRSNAERVLLSLNLQNLKRALDSGQKFGTELEQIQKISGETIDLSALAKFKDEGVPATPGLVKDFKAAAIAAIDASRGTQSSSVWDRLIDGAKSIVHIRRVSEVPDENSVEAVTGRMETALAEARLGDFVKEAKGLPPKAQDAVKSVVDRVNARLSVETAVASLETQLKTSISGAESSAPQPAP